MKEKWIRELLSNLDNFVEEKTKQKILEQCGTKCPYSHMPEERIIELRNEAESERDFLERLCAVWHLSNEEGEYHVIFDQCYCPLVNSDPHNISKTMCYCTLGNLKHKFTLSLGREIEVEMQQTILAGDDICKFKIYI